MHEEDCVRNQAVDKKTCWEDTAEQLRVQLAGCAVAALGGTKDPAHVGDYGWSPSYQDTLNLRIKYDGLLKLLEAAQVICEEGDDV